MIGDDGDGLELRVPRLTPPTMADFSAHTVSPKTTFSTLQPTTTAPSGVRSAAPTRKREYGAWA